MSKIVLGCYARDKISGFEGYLTSRLELFNGCIQYGIQPTVAEGKTNEHPKSLSMDAQQIEYVKDGPLPVPEEPSCRFVCGDKVRDKVHGLVGTIVEKVLFLNGCLYLQVELEGRFGDDGKPVLDWGPYQRFDLWKVPVTKKMEEPKQETKRPGGPVREAPSMW